MSAYVVNRLHVDLLVRLILDGPAGVPVDPSAAWYLRTHVMGTADELGAALIREDVESVAYRYGEAPEAGTLPGPVDRYYLRPYRYERPPHRLTVPEALKAINGYEYQSCEHPGWRTSAVRALCDELRARLIARVPGYDAAPWTWSAEDVEDRRPGVTILSREPDGFTALLGGSTE